MFSVLFPGQGSQNIGMAKELFENFNYVKEYFLNADELLSKKLSKIILDGSKEELDKTENTQPAIFLVSYSIFKVIEKETEFNLKDAKYFAGHSLGEYSALCCAETITFEQTIKASKKLKSLNFDVDHKIKDFLGHGIDEDGLEYGLEFIKKTFNI